MEEKQYLEKNITMYNYIKEKGKEIQKQYSFILPDYVLEEIVKNKDNKEKLILFINLARINNRLTEKEASLLKHSLFNENGKGVEKCR